MHRRFVTKFTPLGYQVGILVGQISTDLKILSRSQIVVANCMNWDIISRGWKKRKQFNRIRLFIVDELHLLG